MRKFVLTLMASLLSCSAATAFWPEATDSSLEVGVGYRQDRLEWRTSSNFDSSSYSEDSYVGLPLNLQSKLKWKDLQIWQIEAQGKYITCDNIYLRANADYGWITHGKNTDSDYVNFGETESSYESYGSESSFEFAHSKSKARGHVYDAKIAIGYQFKMCDDSFAISPLVGYSWHGQHIKDKHLKENFYIDETLVDIDVVQTRAHSADHASISDFSGSDSYTDSYSSSEGKKHSHLTHVGMVHLSDLISTTVLVADAKLIGNYLGLMNSIGLSIMQKLTGNCVMTCQMASNTVQRTLMARYLISGLSGISANAGL